MDLFDFSKLIVILIIFLGSTLVYPQVRAMTFLLTGVIVLVLSLKAKKSREAEPSDEVDKSWMIGCIFGAGMAFVGGCGLLNLIF